MLQEEEEAQTSGGCENISCECETLAPITLVARHQLWSLTFLDFVAVVYCESVSVLLSESVLSFFPFVTLSFFFLYFAFSLGIWSNWPLGSVLSTGFYCLIMWGCCWGIFFSPFFLITHTSLWFHLSRPELKREKWRQWRKSLSEKSSGARANRSNHWIHIFGVIAKLQNKRQDSHLLVFEIF